jgi:uncharacterized protein with HEPN domain
MRDDRERLTDILRAIDRIMDKTVQGRRAFEGDEMLQVWVLHHLQILGEASRCLSDEFRRPRGRSLVKSRRHAAYPGPPPLRRSAGQIWKVVEQDLRPLRDRVASILTALGPGE